MAIPDQGWVCFGLFKDGNNINGLGWEWGPLEFNGGKGWGLSRVAMGGFWYSGRAKDGVRLVFWVWHG